MARLIRTEKEVEGRFEEVWLVVEEDPLEQWPAGPLERRRAARAARSTALERARGEARFTADIRLPGMLHAAVLRSPYAHARVRAHRPRAGARAARRPRRDRPGRGARARRRRRLRGRGRRRRRAPTRFAQARAAVARDRGRVGGARGRARSRRSGRGAGSSPSSRARYERGDVERASRRGGRRRRGDVPHAGRRSTTRWRRTRRSAEWLGDTLEVYISTQYIWGVRRRARRAARPARATRCASSASTWAAASARRTSPDDYTFVAAELAKRTGRPVRCALTRREENIAAGNRNATIQRLVAGARSRRHARSRSAASS